MKEKICFFQKKLNKFTFNFNLTNEKLHAYVDPVGVKYYVPVDEVDASKTTTKHKGFLSEIKKKKNSPYKLIKEDFRCGPVMSVSEALLG